MAVFDTDTDRLDNDNRRIMERISLENLAERNFKIVWMDFCIEDVMERSVPGFNRGNRNEDMASVKVE